MIDLSRDSDEDDEVAVSSSLTEEASSDKKEEARSKGLASSAASGEQPPPAPDDDPSSPSAAPERKRKSCPTCGVEFDVRVSRSAKNPGRKYYTCRNACTDGFVGWANPEDEADVPSKSNNIGCAGSSYATIKAAEQLQTSGTAKRSRERHEEGTRGNVVGFDRSKKIVSKEDARKDPKAFKPVTLATLKSQQSSRSNNTTKKPPSRAKKTAAPPPAPPPPPSNQPPQQPPSAEELRRARLARFATK